MLLIFYYSAAIVQFLQHEKIATDWIVNSLDFYRNFILNYWPQFDGIPILGSHFLGMQVDDNYTPSFLPIVILWVGGIVRFVVDTYVPHNRLREVTREYWLYLTFLLILLIIISNVLNWNFLFTFVVFLLILFIIATGLYGILNDLWSLIFNTARHIGKWIWITLQNIAGIAADIAKFLHHVPKRIREIYDKYIRQPFRRLNEWLSNIENKQEVKVKERLNKKSLDD